MALTPYTGTIAASTLNNNFLDKSSAIVQANATAKSHVLQHRVPGLDSASTELERTWEFTPDDDYELRLLALYKEQAAATVGVTLTLELESVGANGSWYLLDKTWSISMTTTATTTQHFRQAYTSASGQRLFLKKGVPYRLKLTSSSATAMDVVDGIMVLRGRRRR